jgi:hypothetical protein
MIKMIVLLETGMLVCFAVGLVSNLFKSIRARTARGRSGVFIALIGIGYIFGLSRKIVGHSFDLAFIFYCFNFCVNLADGCFFLRNKKLDQKTKSCPS